MSTPIPFNKDFSHEPGEVVELHPLVRRITAPNESAFTFKGTNTYIVGRGNVAVVDPGPEDPTHIARIMGALEDAGDQLTHIVVTHTHRDHSPGATLLQEMESAPTWGYGPHGIGSRQDWPWDSPEGGDRNFRPDHQLQDGEVIKGDGWSLEAIYTPGHISNHLCFAIPEANAILSGDHVMGWSTSVVSPPDGDMGNYMKSLERMLGRPEPLYWPGHGGPIDNPKELVEAYIAHRRKREEQIRKLIADGKATIPAMVAAIYTDVPEALHRAAGRSVLSHLIDMWERGIVEIDGHVPGPEDEYRLK